MVLMKYLVYKKAINTADVIISTSLQYPKLEGLKLTIAILVMPMLNYLTEGYNNAGHLIVGKNENK